MKVGHRLPVLVGRAGGVQSHIRDLAEALIDAGHQVSVISPADDDTPLPPYVTGGRPGGARALQRLGGAAVVRLPVGRAGCGAGSRTAASTCCTCTSPRSRACPCWPAGWPRALSSRTFHTADPALARAAVTYPVVRTGHGEDQRPDRSDPRPRVTRWSSTSAATPWSSRTAWQLGRFAQGRTATWLAGPGGAIGFLGRMDEPRKGLSVLLKAFETLGSRTARARGCWSLDRADDPEEVLQRVPAELRDRVVLLGQINDEDKVRALHSVDVYCAPNTGGESFGIVTAEAMAAGVPIVASDIDAFRQVLRGGEAGELFTTGDAGDLARAAAAAAGRPGPPGRAVRRGAGRGGRLRLVGRRPLRAQRVRDRRPRQHAGRRHRAAGASSRDHRHRHRDRGRAVHRRVRVLARPAGSTGCTSGWTWPAPPWTRPCSGAARWPWSWPPPGCSTRPPACSWPPRCTVLVTGSGDGSPRSGRDRRMTWPRAT